MLANAHAHTQAPVMHPVIDPAPAAQMHLTHAEGEDRTEHFLDIPRVYAGAGHEGHGAPRVEVEDLGETGYRP